MEELSDFQRRLETRFPALTKSEQRIASFLLADYDQAAFLSAAELARTLGVSEATVVRFARSIGFESYPQLRRCLQDLYRSKVTPASRLQQTLAGLSSGQGHVLTKVIDMELQYLTEAGHTLHLAEFDRAVDLLVHAPHVFVYASGPSAAIAELAETRLRRFGLAALALTDSGRNLTEKLQLFRPGDVVLAAAFNHLNAEVVAVLEHARRTDCRAILLTDTLGHALRDKADVILAARRGPVSTFHSLVVPMTILNALLLAVAMARPAESLAALQQFQELRTDYGLEGPGQGLR